MYIGRMEILFWTGAVLGWVAYVVVVIKHR